MCAPKPKISTGGAARLEGKCEVSTEMRSNTKGVPRLTNCVSYAVTPLLLEY